MIVITDSNIVFSALYSPNGVIASILKNKGHVQLFAPDYLVIEVKNHLDKIIENRKTSKRKILLELNSFLENITIIEVDKIPKSTVVQAVEMVKDIDVDDIFFVALHLYKKHKIWTSDKVLIDGLEKKGFKICITTAELKAKLYKK